MVRLAPWDKVLTVVHLFLMGRLLAAQVVLAAAVVAVIILVAAMAVPMVPMVLMAMVMAVKVKAPPLVNLVKQALRYILVEEAVAQEVAKLVMAVLAAAVTETLTPLV